MRDVGAARLVRKLWSQAKDWVGNANSYMGPLSGMWGVSHRLHITASFHNAAHLEHEKRKRDYGHRQKELQDGNC